MTQTEPKNMNKLLAIAGAVLALILLLLYSVTHKHGREKAGG